MSADEPRVIGETAPQPVQRRPFLKRLAPRVPDWRPAAKRAAGAIAAVAAVGAVLGGLVGFWSTYKVVVGEWFGQKPAVTVQAKLDVPAAFNPPRLSIALLPFDNLSGDASQDYFGDGVVENLTTDLSIQNSQLLVIARGAAFSYKGQRIDSKQIGRELNVRYLLQGSVQRSDTNVRINARLVDTENGEQLWAERFDGDISNILALQDQIAARIATSLRFAFVAAGIRQADKRSNSDVFDLLLRAQSALFTEYRLGILHRNNSIDLYRKALAIEPDNADAQIGLGLVLAEVVAFSRFNPPASRPSAARVQEMSAEANELLSKGSRVKQTSPDVHYARARLHGFNLKWDDARQEAERALAINPGHTASYGVLAEAYVLLGKPHKGIATLEEMQRRTAGKIPAYRFFLGQWGRAFLLIGRWDEAIEKLQHAQTLRSEPQTHGFLAAANAQLGRFDAAKASLGIWQADYTSRVGSPPTIKAIVNARRLVSEDPEYLRLSAATYDDGLRKLGVPEE